ncbi:hypothetical protein PR202_ga31517 [Eleusine coracana subsp. coracana]|uniref:Uncharacterized protein n=1 Tax=Eleusine coracana subsp. coracana TaxID=191504 RepID=A0AAV5DRM3_ELECO|nr:hypothetical protein PR202_ga31517 [Eleusine coracana subsp. coracana]
MARLPRHVLTALAVDSLSVASGRGVLMVSGTAAVMPTAKLGVRRRRAQGVPEDVAIGWDGIGLRCGGVLKEPDEAVVPDGAAGEEDDAAKRIEVQSVFRMVTSDSVLMMSSTL